MKDISTAITVLLVLSIIFFIFVCEYAKGQVVFEATLSNEDVIGKDSIEVTINNTWGEHWDNTEIEVPDSSFIKAEHFKLNPIYDKDAFDYIEECYNDSTLIYYNSSFKENYSRVEWELKNFDNWYDDEIWIVVPIDSLFTIGYWQHKEPTFGGFIEWLKK